jgi:hypothetical protein
LVRSARLAGAGALVLCVSFAALLIAMPRFTPFEFQTCTPAAPTQSFPQGGTQCTSGLNPAYPLVFLLSVAGTVILLVGLFGGRFVLSPASVIGIIALEWGLAAIVSASLGTHSGVGVNPALFSPFVVIGAVVLCIQAIRYPRGRTP